ncbi:MAG: hypothetical protein UV65_C0003G0008 [Parcubacteria group bacterium GW2011_GWF2_43_11]|nr:MAG: hypothetical protein UV65_C0003G0008 [Parcubacteria group bacterium GW2011_GWF2_43_11]
MGTNQIISPKIVALVFGVLVVSFAVAFYVVGWTEPTQAPPGGNVSAPLNTSSATQSKTGILELIGGLRLPGGAGVGKVLTSDASGNVSWQSASGGYHFQKWTTSGTYSFTIPSGVTGIMVEVWGAGGGGIMSHPGGTGLGGGGGAGYGKGIYDVTPGTIYTVTVGAGGSYGSSVPCPGSNGGGSGGISSFGSLVQATGGGGGSGSCSYTCTLWIYSGGGGGAGGSNGNIAARSGTSGGRAYMDCSGYWYGSASGGSGAMGDGIGNGGGGTPGGNGQVIVWW